MSIFGEFLEDNSTELVSESAGTDIFEIFMDTKKFYREDMAEFDKAIKDYDDKKAKEIITALIKKIESSRSKIKAIDDSNFTDKASTYAIKTLHFMLDTIIKISPSAVATGAGSIAGQAVVKGGVSLKDTGKTMAISAIGSAVIAIAKEAKKQKEIANNRQLKIREKMKKDNIGKKEATKEIGTMYKNEVLDFLDDIYTDCKKMSLKL